MLSETKDPTQSVVAPEGEYMRLPVVDCIPSGDNPRTEFDDDAEEEGGAADLAESIKEDGLYQTVVAMPIPADRIEEFYLSAIRRFPMSLLALYPADHRPTFVVVAGERRWRAALRVGRSYLHTLSFPFDWEHAERIMVSENAHRKALSSWDLANYLQRQLEKMQKKNSKVTQGDLAMRFRLRRETVSNLLRMLSLPEDLKLFVRDRRLNAFDAVLLGRVEDTNKRQEYLTLLMQGSIPRKQWQDLVRAYVHTKAEEQGKKIRGRAVGTNGRGVTARFVERFSHAPTSPRTRADAQCCCKPCLCPVHGLMRLVPDKE